MLKYRLEIQLEKAKDHARKLKKEVLAIYLACKRKDVPWYAKIIPVLVVGYALSPIDLIPDFIPVLGYLYDLILVPLGIALAIKLIPKDKLDECRSQAEETFKNGKPKNWVAGLIIILLWFLLGAWIVVKFFGTYSFNEISISNLYFLFCGSFLAAAISGAAGFGGALLLLPLLTYTIGTTMAVPVLTLAQLIGNLSRVSIGFRQIKWKPVLIFIVGAVPAAIVGACFFAIVPTDIITRLIGGSIIVFVVLKYFKLIQFKSGNITMVCGGVLVGLLSGLVGSAGPMGAAIFLSLNLPPVAYIASEAVTATAMHIVKTIVYQKYIGIGMKEVALGLFMGVGMIIGTWAGKKFIENMPKEKFIKFVGVLLCLVGLQMIVFG